jgi:hypothetical protein
MHGALLLTGGDYSQSFSHLTCTKSRIGNDSRIVVWSLVSGEMIQEIFTPAAGYISAITWMDVDDRGETTFAFGASDGNIQVYERSHDVSDRASLLLSLMAVDHHRRCSDSRAQS